jgi:two-component system NarL family sensor kinase
MKFTRYLIFLIFSLPWYGKAQQQDPGKDYKDSLSYILTQQKADSVKARISFLLSDEWSYTDTLKAKQFLENGRKFSGGNKYLKALYHFYQGQLFFDIDRPRAKRSFLKADSLLLPFVNAEAYYFRARAWHNYGAMCQIEDNNYEAMLSALTDKAIPLAIKSGNKEYIAQNYADIGLIFSNNLQYDKAKFYYDKSLILLSKAKKAGSNKVYIYIDAIRNLLYMNNLGEAKKLLNKLRPMIVPGLESEIGFLEMEGLYFIESKQYQSAINSLNKALADANKLKKPNLGEKILFQKYRAYTGMGRYDKAKEILLALIKNPILKSNNNRLLQYYELAGTYARLGDMQSAYKWQKEYSSLMDSTGKSQLNREINALEIKFRNAESQRKIAELNTANTKAALDAKNSRLINWLLGSASLFLLVFAASIYFFYRSYQRSSAQKAQIEITEAMIKAQNKERSRIARDLHDGLGGMLTTIKRNVEDYAHENKNSDHIKLNTMVSQLNGSIKELRQIAHNMMPEMLLKLGLEASLKDLCVMLTTKSLHVDFHCLGIQNTILVDEQITIYRIIQELLTNTVKHADATHVLLQCAQHEKVFFITIEDDGKGFDTDVLTQMQGIGLSNIKNRVAYLHGNVEFLSREHQGTSINIELNVTA